MTECDHSLAGFGANQVASAEDADRRRETNEVQVKCPVCELWIWESMFYDKKGRDG